jgi:hypothetical protein
MLLKPTGEKSFFDALCITPHRIRDLSGYAIALGPAGLSAGRCEIIRVYSCFIVVLLSERRCSENIIKNECTGRIIFQAE